MAWCGDEGDAYPDPPVLSDECREVRTRVVELRIWSPVLLLL